MGSFIEFLRMFNLNVIAKGRGAALLVTPYTHPTQLALTKPSIIILGEIVPHKTTHGTFFHFILWVHFIIVMFQQVFLQMTCGAALIHPHSLSTMTTKTLLAGVGIVRVRGDRYREVIPHKALLLSFFLLTWRFLNIPFFSLLHQRNKDRVTTI